MTHPTDALRLVPVNARDLDALRYVLNRADDSNRIRTVMTTFTLPERETTAERLERLYAALKAPPASPLPGGGPYERWSILNHLGESWTPENFDTERQATAFLDRWKRDNPKMDLSKHKVIPVLVTMTAAPTGAK